MIKFQLPFKKSSFAKASEDRERKPSSVLGLRPLKEKKQPKISRKKILSFLTILGSVLIIYGIFFVVKKNPFAIQKVDFKTSDLSCVSNDQIKGFLNVQKNNIFSFDTAKQAQQLQQKFVCIEMVTIRKKFPSSLEVSANDRKSAAVIKVFQLPQLDLKIEDATSSTQAAILVDNVSNALENSSFVVDDQGVIIKADDGQSGLQQIDFYNQGGPIKVGSKLPTDLIAKAMMLINGANQQNLVINKAKVIDSGLFLIGDSQLPSSENSKVKPIEIEYIFSLDKDPDRQLATLQLILHQATIDSKTIQKVDLRFDKVVVVYSGNR